MSIPGGWEVGDECYFSDSDKPFRFGLPGRTVGVITGYCAETNILEITVSDRVIKQRHSLDFGGISGVPRGNAQIIDDA